VSLPDLNPTAPVDLEQLLPDVYEAVQWACIRYWGRVRRDELDDFSQQIILKLFEDDCRRLHSFKGHSLPKTWLQRVVDNHIYSCLSRRRQGENPDDVDRGTQVYLPPQDRNIYTAEQQTLLSRALARLSEQERLLYQLCFVFEQDARKVATVFNINVKNVYKRKEMLVLKLTKLVQAFHSR
jgi:RNA polymerase sigma factor (sigma-70 family)